MKSRFFFNMNTCIGCGSCQIACKDAHDLRPGEYFRKAGIQTMQTACGAVHLPFSMSCNHCEHPACVSVCPTGAMHTTDDGLTLHDDSLCIACSRCYWACPYGQVSFSSKTGLTQKCDTCLHLRSQGLPTACQAACPTASIRFGETDEGEPLSLPFLPDACLTEPSTKIKRAKAVKCDD